MRRARALLAAAFLAAGCSHGGAEPTIDRQTFIDTYVELRLAVLLSPEGILSDADRERILARHGVTAEDLVRFTEVRGSDPDFMLGVWSEVSSRLDPSALNSAPTSAPSFPAESAG